MQCCLWSICNCITRNSLTFVLTTLNLIFSWFVDAKNAKWVQGAARSETPGRNRFWEELSFGTIANFQLVLRTWRAKTDQRNVLQLWFPQFNSGRASFIYQHYQINTDWSNIICSNSSHRVRFQAFFWEQLYVCWLLCNVYILYKSCNYNLRDWYDIFKLPIWRMWCAQQYKPHISSFRLNFI